MTCLLANWLKDVESLVVHLTSSSHCSASSTAADVDDNHRSNYQDNIARQLPSFEEISKCLLGPVYGSLSPVVKATTTELATLCAEMEVYSCEMIGSSQSDEEVRKTSTSGEQSDTHNTSTMKRYMYVGYVHVHVHQCSPSLN